MAQESAGTPETTQSDSMLAQDNWERYEYGRSRGHMDYCAHVRRCEDMYLGGGRQWTDEDKEILRQQGRPAYEFNEIKPGVNAAIGYQIHNRMDITYLASGIQSSAEIATSLSKLAMQICRNSQYHWKETQLFSDGLIQQRGYLDIRMDFDENIRGEVAINTLDPMDVIPDPDAKEYDPDTWGDVIVTRFMTPAKIEAWYGSAARTKVENRQGTINDSDFGDDNSQEGRSKFGEINNGQYDTQFVAGNKVFYRVIDRQYWVYEMTKCAVFPTGDVRPIPDATPEQIAGYESEGAIITRRMAKRIKWRVSTHDTVLHDDYSPYKHFTVLPYFAYFRRGRTGGMVDDAIGPQEALNKSISQVIHVINTTANSGWVVEENSLTNMDTDDLEDQGSKTGLVVEYKKGSQKPEKIQPNAIPTGLDKVIGIASSGVKAATTPDAMRGENGQEVSGIAIQSKQFASQQQLAVAMDNLAYTRRLLAIRIIDLIQTFYDDPRIVHITSTDVLTGKETTEPMQINIPMTDGTILNDLTLGEYAVAISEVPMQVTFENSQFNQIVELRKAGFSIPDDVAIRHSNLMDKQEIIERMNSQPSDPEKDAKVALVNAQAKKTAADTVAQGVTALYSAIQTASTIAAVPATAPLADKLLRSAGFQDQDAAPIVPEGTGLEQVAALPHNTNPMTPASPAMGMDKGIKTPTTEDNANAIA